VTRRAGTISATGVIEMDAKVQRHVEQRLFLAVILVWQFAVLECDSFSLGKKRDFNRVFAGGIHRRRSTALRFMLRHRYS